MLQFRWKVIGGSSNRVLQPASLSAARAVVRLAAWRSQKIVALLLCAGLCLPVLAEAAWYNPGWQNRKTITLNGGQITGNLTNFPVLISLTDTDISASAQASGNDILFTDSDGTTKLNHEIERYVTGSGLVLAWVRIPTLSAGSDKTLYIYYGNAGAANQQNGTGVWDGNYRAVWHLDENTSDETSVTNMHQDATSNNQDADQHNGVDANARIYRGQDLDGSNDDIDTNIASSSLTNFTYSAWFRADNAGAIGNDSVAQRVLTQRRSSSGTRFAMGINNNRFSIFWSDGNSNLLQGSTTLNNSSYYYGTVTYNGTTLYVYLNGNQEATASEGSMTAGSADTIMIGAQSPGNREFNGMVDEVRISAAARSANWVKTEYNNQNNPGIGGFIKTLGAQQSDGTAPATISDLASGVVTDLSVQLTWTAPGDDNTTGTATSYDIRYRTDTPLNAGNWVTSTVAAGAPAPALAGSSESFTVTGLSSDTLYYFAIKTGDEVVNWSGVSNSIGVTTLVDNVAPSTVSNLAVTNVWDTSIQLTWSAPGDSGNIGTASYYDVRYRTDAPITAANWGNATPVTGEPVPSVAGSPESFIVTGLSSGVTYYFALRSLDEAFNWSAVSNSPSGTTSGVDGFAPGQITNLSTIGTPTSGTIYLTWTAPGDDAYTGTAASYDLRYATATITAANWASATQVTGEPTPQLAGNTEFFAVSNLNPATKYYFAIIARDEAANSAPLSNNASNTTAAATTGTIVILHPSGTAAGDSATYNGASAVTALDTNDGSSTYGYSGNSDTDYYLNIDDTTLKGDINSVTVKVYVAKNNFEDNSFSFRIGVDVNGSQNFSGSLSHGSTTYSQYSGNTLTKSPATGQAWSWPEINNLIAILDHSDSDNMRLTELYVEVDYNPADTSPPAQITNLATTASTDNTVTLTWTAPGDDGISGTASSYDIRYATTPITSANWNSATQVTGEPLPAAPGTAQTFTVSGLAANTLYYFAIRAKDEVPNISALSNIASATTTAVVSIDLSLTNSVSTGTPLVGGNVSFTLALSNTGAIESTNVTVQDLLPSGYTFVSATPSQGSYLSVTGLWTVGTIASAASATLDIVATVKGSGVYNNYAQVNTADQLDVDSIPGNNSTTEDDDASRSTTPVARIDLSMGATVDNNTPNVGSNVTFSLTLSNVAGLSNASNVSVTDLLPSGYGFVSATPSQGTYNSGTGVWTVTTVNAGASATLNIVATVLGSGVYSNFTQVTAADQTDVDSVAANGSNAEDDNVTLPVLPVARIDLSLTNTVSNATPNVGGNVTFTLNIANATALSTATNVVVIDFLPAGYSFVSAAGTGTYNAGSGVWTVGTVTAGAAVSLDIVATVMPGGSYSNFAQVTGADQTDVDSVPNNGNNGEDDNVTRTTAPIATVDLALTKIVSNTNPNVGSDVTFTLTLSNAAGLSAATNVQVTDLLPSGYNYVSDTGAGAYVAGTGVWTLGTVAAGASTSIDIVATVLGSGSYSNYAQVSAVDQYDRDSIANNNSTTEDDDVTLGITPAVLIDLSLLMGVDNSAPNVGNNVIFTVTVSNTTGMSNAGNVQVVDLLPSGYTFVGAAPSQGGYAAGSGVWTVGALNAGNSATLVITARVRGSGTYLNKAEVAAADQPDRDSTPGNNSTTEDDDASSGTTPVPTVDLALTQTVDTATPGVGGNITFTLTLTNAADMSAATNITINDTLPAGYTFIGYTSSQGIYNTGTGVWSAGNLAAGASATLAITARVLGSGAYVSYAEVTAVNQGDIDSTPNNGSTTEDDDSTLLPSPVPRIDLALIKTVDDATPVVSQLITFTLTLTNAAGMSDATGVTVSDPIPTGYAFSSAVPSQGSYNAGTGIWSVATLNAGASATLSLSVTVQAAGIYNNYAQVSAANEADIDSVANNGSITEDDDAISNVTPSAQIDLSLGMAVSNGTPNVGDNITFTLTIQNAVGMSNATNVQVTNALPSGYRYVSNSGGANYAAGMITWDAGTIVANGSASLDIVATVLGAGGYTNYAQVSAADEGDLDSNPGDNSTTEDDDSSVGITPNARIDLFLSNSVDNATPNVGDDVTFVVTVANTADFSFASNISVTDALPSGYSFVSYSANQGSYVSASGVWSVGNLGAGGNAVLRITATVLGTGVYTNIAEVSAATEIDFDSIPGNANPAEDDYAAQPVATTAQVDLSLTNIVSNSAPNVASNVVFTLTLQNTAGLSNATNVLVRDVLPSGYAYVSSIPSQGFYTTATGIWNVGTVNAGSGATLAITVTVLGAGSYNNYAEVSAVTETDTDSVPGNNSTTEDDDAAQSINPVPRIDLSLAMTVDNGTPDVGGTIIYILTASNAASVSNATNVKINDVLPTGYSFVSATPSQGSYNNGSGIWTVNTLNAGANATLTITATVLGSGSYGNFAEVSAADQIDIDSIPANGSTVEDDYVALATTPNAIIDLMLTQAVSNAAPNVGTTVTFTLTVSNVANLSTATNVTVTDLLPAGYGYVSDSAGGGYAPGSGIWSVGAVNAGTNVSMSITATVLGSGGYSNYAEITAADQTDSDSIVNNASTTEDDDATATTTPVPTVDLALTNTVDNATPNVGSTVTFTLSVDNAAGMSNAGNVTVTDQLPAGYTYVSDTGAGSYQPGTGVWTVGALNAGTSATLGIVAVVRGSGAYNNYAQITAADQGDADSVVNNASTTEDDDAARSITPNPRIDLSLAMSVDNGAPVVGSNVTFTLTLANSADLSTATSIMVTDLLPSGYSYVDSVPSQGSYNAATGKWPAGTINAGASATLTITAVVLGNGSYSNYAEVTAADQVDLDSVTNNASTTEDDDATIATTPLIIDLAVAKTVDNNIPNEGDGVTFSIVVTNNGPTPATNVSLNDLLPSGLLPGSAAPSQGSYDGTTWNIGTLGFPGSATLLIPVTVESGTAGITITNTVTNVSFDQADNNATPDDLNETLNIGADLIAPADISNLLASSVTDTGLTLTWTAPGDNANVGTAAVYDLRYSTTPLTPANWDTAIQVSGLPTPSPSGSSESWAITGLIPNTPYYFAIVTIDEVANAGNLSNIVVLTTQGNAVTSAIGEIVPHAIGAGTTNNFRYDILPTINAAANDTGVNRIAITAAAVYTNLAITGVLVNGLPVVYIDSSTGNVLQVDLAAKILANDRITVLFIADAGTNVGSTSFTAVVDDTTTVSVSAQTVSAGNANGDGSDLNNQLVAIEGLAASAVVAEITPAQVSIGTIGQILDFHILPTLDIAAGDSGIDTITITLPSTTTNTVVNGISVGGAALTAGAGCPGVINAGEFCVTITGLTINIQLGTPVTTDQTAIVVNLTTDVAAVLSTNPVIITIDDSKTVTPPQNVSAGDADGDPSNGNALNFVIQTLVDAVNSRITVTPDIVLADGVNTGTIGVTLLDYNNQPKIGKQVAVFSSRNAVIPTDIVTQPAGVTDNNGYSTGLIASTQPGIATIGARETGDNITLAAQPTVYFTQGIVIDLRKTANKSSAVVGEVITYLVELRNTTNRDIVLTRLVDRIPAYFKFVAGSGRVNGMPLASVTSNRELVFNLDTLPALGDTNGNGRADPGEAGYSLVTYQLIVGAGAKPGGHINSAWVTDVCDRCLISNTDQHEVEVRLDPMYDLGTIIGKVFSDRNENGVQDRNEPGMAGVELVLDNGLRVITDVYGRYHIPAVTPGQRLLKINLQSINDFAITTTDDLKVVSVTPGLLAKANFGVTYKYDELTIGRPDVHGLDITGYQQDDELQVQGNVRTMSVLVNGKELNLPKADASFITKALEDVVEIHGDSLHKLIEFETVLTHNADVSSWKISIANSQAQPVRTLSGSGTPPQTVTWDGICDDGTLLLANELYRYQLELTYADNSLAVSPKRYFGVNKKTIVSLNLSSGAFKTDSDELTGDAKAILKDAAQKIRQYPNELITIDGHSDNIGDATYNMELSERRANAALEYLVTAENLSRKRLVARGFGETRPVASNATEEGRDINRRIEINGTVSDTTRVEMSTRDYQTPLVLLNHTRVAIDPYGRFFYPLDTAQNRSLSLELTSAQGQVINSMVGIPSLEVIRPIGHLILPYGGTSDAYQVIAPAASGSASNDAQSVLTFELTGQTEPGNSVQLDGTALAVDVAGQFSASLNMGLGNTSFEFLIANKYGLARLFHLHMNVLDKDANGNPVIAIEKIPSLDIKLPKTGMTLTSPELTVAGNTDPGNRVTINQHIATVNSQGDFSEVITLPMGASDLIVSVDDPDGHEGTITRQVAVTDDRMFFLAFADGTVGQLHQKGYISGDGTEHNKEYYQEGRVAYYLKGTIAGKYIIRSAYDSGAQDDNLFADLNDDEQNGLLAHIDPEKIYPVYGDDSQLEYDTPRRGKFYLALESAEFQVLAGNFNTRFGDAELTAYERKLYGAQVRYQSTEHTRYDQPRTQTQAYGAEVRQLKVTNDLLATGGSLYYLSHDNIVKGSEQLSIVAEDAVTGLTLSKTPLRPDLDYTINYEQGRILLRSPLSQTQDNNQLINITQLAGNPLYLHVEFETATQGFKKLTQGVRVEQQLGDHVGIGVSHVKDELDIGAYELQGADTTFRFGPGAGSWIKFEAATSKGTGSYAYNSEDGGLNFRTEPLQTDAEGSAWKTAANIDFRELLGESFALRLKAYALASEAGFQLNDRHLNGDARNSGVELAYALGSMDTVTLAHQRDEHGATASTDGRDANTSNSMSWRHSGAVWSLGTELLNRETSSSANGIDKHDTTDLAALELKRALGEAVVLRLRHQEPLDTQRNRQSTAGINYKMSALFDLGVSFTNAQQGNSAQASASYGANGDRVYLAERLQEHDTAYGTTSVVGAEAGLGHASTVYSEYQFSGGATDDIGSSLVGTKTRFELAEGLSLNMYGEFSGKESGSNDRYRSLLGTTLGFKSITGIQLYSKEEVRREWGASRTYQFLSVNNMDFRLHPDYSLLAKYRVSHTLDTRSEQQLAKFKEQSFGLAYRPVAFDWFNGIARFTMQDEMRPHSADSYNAYRTLSEIASVEWAWDFSRYAEWVVKQALKVANERLPTYPTTSSHTRLSIQRLNLHVWPSIDLGMEYRKLSQAEARDFRSGWLLEASWRLNRNIRWGVGYNFTDFSDNEFSSNDYSTRGTFMRVQGTY